MHVYETVKKFVFCRLVHGTRFVHPSLVYTGTIGVDPRCTGPGRFFGDAAYVLYSYEKFHGK